MNLRDGSYTTTQIYSVFGVPDSENEDKLQPVGKFFVQGGNPGDKCAYQLPGGALAMQFKSGGFTPHPDGQGGQFLEETFELAILEATGAYRDFQGGHNLKTPLICQTGPKTSAKSGCSCSMWEKRCISGRSLSSGIVGIRS